jgi:hypothetical protein
MTLKWSNSADWALQRCRRRFWFQYLHADPRAVWGSAARETNILSNIQTYETWRGSLVHTIIQKFVIPSLRDGHLPSENFLHNAALELATRQIEFSAKRLYRSNNMTKSKAGDAYAALWEDEFGELNSTLSKNEAMDEALLALSNLLTFKDLLSDLSEYSWMEAEATIELKGNTGIPVTGRVDLLAISRDRNINLDALYLIDWKLVRNLSYDYAPQLWLYAYLIDSNRTTDYKDSSFNQSSFPDDIKSLPKHLLEVNLLQKEIEEVGWNEQIRSQVEDRIFRGIRRIQAILDGRSYRSIEASELYPTENSNNCIYCPFRGPCQNI